MVLHDFEGQPMWMFYAFMLIAAAIAIAVSCNYTINHPCTAQYCGITWWSSWKFDWLSFIMGTTCTLLAMRAWRWFEFDRFHGW